MTNPPPKPAPRFLSWTGAVTLALAVTAARLLLLAFGPYELTADEAHYWEWSRRLDLSYYSKGPGIAWLIALFTTPLGDNAFAVRLPAALCGLASLLLAARFAWELAHRDRRAACYAVILWLAIPAYHATALVSTIDGPYILCWLATAYAAFHALSTPPNRAAKWWALTALALGVGFLFKYTILLLIPGIALAALLNHRRPRPAHLAIASAVFLLSISPVLIWNHQQGWPTVKHLLGHLGLPGGDLPPQTSEPKPWSPLWPLELIASQLAIVGPALALFALAYARERTHPARAPAARFLLACAAPILVFYLAVSFVTDAEGNWPIAAYATLVPLAAAAAVPALATWRARLDAWRRDPHRPKLGTLRRAPESPFQIAWDWSVGWGVAAALGMALLLPLSRLPLLDQLIPDHRLVGGRALAQRVAHITDDLARATDQPPAILAERYTTASLLAFYLPGQPTVLSASAALGDRRSAYDLFPDTNLPAALADHPPAVMVGGGAPKWNRAFRLRRFATPDPATPIHTAASIAPIPDDAPADP